MAHVRQKLYLMSLPPFLKESRLDLLTKELTRLMRETGDE